MGIGLLSRRSPKLSSHVKVIKILPTRVYPPLSFRGPDPDSDCYENFRVNAELLGCLNWGFLIG